MKEKSVTERRQHVLLARAAGTPNGARTANLAAAGARGLSFSELHVLQPRLFRHSLSTDALDEKFKSLATGREYTQKNVPQKSPPESYNREPKTCSARAILVLAAGCDTVVCLFNACDYRCASFNLPPRVSHSGGTGSFSPRSTIKSAET